MENKINKYLGYLAEISAFLSEMKHRAHENDKNIKVSEAVENFLDGFNFSPLHGEPFAPMRDVNVASQRNISNKNKGFSLSEEEIEKMLIEFEGMSITKKPRKDGRFQGYIYVKGEKKYVYGYSRAEVAGKIR